MVKSFLQAPGLDQPAASQAQGLDFQAFVVFSDDKLILLRRFTYIYIDIYIEQVQVTSYTDQAFECQKRLWMDDHDILVQCGAWLGVQTLHDCIHEFPPKWNLLRSIVFSLPLSPSPHIFDIEMYIYVHFIL